MFLSASFFPWPWGLVFGHDAFAFMLVVSGRGSDSSVHDGRFFHASEIIYSIYFLHLMLTVWDDLGTFSSYTQSYPHPIRPGNVLHTFLLCLSRVLEDPTINNSQITLSTKLYLIYSVNSVACARLVGVRLNHSPQSFVHETLHTGWERSDLSWLGGGFNFLLFSPLVGENFKFDRYLFKRVGSTTNQMTINWRASFLDEFRPKAFPFFWDSVPRFVSSSSLSWASGTYHMNGFPTQTRKSDKIWNALKHQTTVQKIEKTLIYSDNNTIYNTCIYSNRIHFRIMFFLV